MPREFEVREEITLDATPEEVWDVVVVEYHSFADDDEDEQTTGRAWRDWLDRTFASRGGS